MTILVVVSAAAAAILSLEIVSNARSRRSIASGIRCVHALTSLAPYAIMSRPTIGL